MMKKSLIALAVMAASGAAFAATSNVDVYGQVRLSVDSVDGAADLRMADRVSRIGIQGKEDLGGGMSAFYHWERTLSFATGVLQTDVAGRLAYGGIEGGFGKIAAGNVYLPYKTAGSASLFEDTAADVVGTLIGGNNFDKPAIGVVYTLPKLVDGLSIAVGTASDTVGTNQELSTDVMSYSAQYTNGPLSVGVAMQEGTNAGGDNTSITDKATKYNVGYNVAGVALKATMEKVTVSGAAKDNVALSAAYPMGAITLAGVYVDSEQANTERYTVGAVYSLSKRTNVAVAYNNDTNKTTSADTGTITVQLNHSF